MNKCDPIVRAAAAAASRTSIFARPAFLSATSSSPYLSPRAHNVVTTLLHCFSFLRAFLPFCCRFRYTLLFASASFFAPHADSGACCLFSGTFIHFVRVTVLALVAVTKTNRQTVGRSTQRNRKEHRQLHVSTILIAVTLLYRRRKKVLTYSRKM